MNINRNNNNGRRRPRNNNRQQGNGQQLNRVDSRARGNAPQLLEKYRKLAQDAHQNGDRVMTEYYLQFADHYFRVLADQRLRQDEQRARRDERWQEGEAERDESEDAGEFSAGSDFPNFAPSPSAPRREREDRYDREDRPVRQDRYEQRGEASDETGEERAEGEINPFTRDNRATRGQRSRNDRNGNDRNGNDRNGNDRNSNRDGGRNRDRNTDNRRYGNDSDSGEQLFDPSSLPPAINISNDDGPVDMGEEAPSPAPVAALDSAPAPRRRVTRRKPAAEPGEALESIG